MFIEFKNYIRQVISSDEFVGMLPALLVMPDEMAHDISSKVDFSNIAFSINKCPKDFSDEMASNVCFVLSKYLHRDFKLEVAPVEIYKMFEKCSAGENLYSIFNYNFSLGAGGYVNATLDKCKFLNSSIWCQHSNIVERYNISCNFFNFLNVAEQDKLQNDLVSFLKSQIKNPDEDVQKVLQVQKELQNLDSILMLSAIKANPELDINNYLRGIYCSENIPYYIQQFLTDSERYLRELFARFIIKSECSIDLFFKSNFWLADALDIIMDYRFEIQQTVLKGKPEKLVLILLSLIKSFYKFYNHPNYRAFKKNTVCYSNLYIIVSILRGLVINTVSYINIPNRL